MPSILNAFPTYEVVAINAGHDDKDIDDFILALIREPRRGMRLQGGAKNRIRGWGRRRGAQTNHRKSWSLNQMKTVSASVTIDALAAPIG
jgi:hypothetical protein